MTFKKGIIKETKNHYIELSYGLNRWLLNMCKKGNENNRELYLIKDKEFKSKEKGKLFINELLKNFKNE